MTKLHEITSRRELFVNLTLRELRGKYKRSALGWAWSLLNPLTTMAVYSFVFGFFLRFEPPTGDPSDLQSFAFFLMCGLIPFNFLSNVLNGAATSLTGNANLVKKTYFPREILVGATTASWLVQFLIELGLLAVALLFVGNVVLLSIPLILLLVVLETVFVLGVALVLAPAAVYFRDLQHLTTLVLQVWFFSAPIVYPKSFVTDRFSPGSWQLKLYDLNPLVRFVDAYRDLMYDLRAPGFGDVAYVAIVAVAALVVGAWAFGRMEGRLAEEL
jgi:ABC-type polysaccharide/polyol phosphate export permease